MRFSGKCTCSASVMGRVASSPPSDCHVAELLLLFVVSAQPPHHAVREDAASPSKPRDPPKRPSRHYLRLHRFPRPGDGPSGGTGPNRPCSEPLFLLTQAVAASRPQRNAVPSTHIR